MSNEITLDTYFAGKEDSRRIFEALLKVVEDLGKVQVRVTKSQIAFRRRRAFAFAWTPETYLRRRCAPLVLTVSLKRHDLSKRWKEVVEPTPGRFIHHLELYSEMEIDDEIRSWLEEAWTTAA